MNIKIPAIITEFLKAKNNYDSAAFAACFTNDATVQDEGREIRGIIAIKKWIEDSNAKYHDTVIAQRLVENDDETILSAQVSGDFEGSPVVLDFHFVVNEGKISRLRIFLADN